MMKLGEFPTKGGWIAHVEYQLPFRTKWQWFGFVTTSERYMPAHWDDNGNGMGIDGACGHDIITIDFPFKITEPGDYRGEDDEKYRVGHFNPDADFPWVGYQCGWQDVCRWNPEGVGRGNGADLVAKWED